MGYFCYFLDKTRKISFFHYPRNILSSFSLSKQEMKLQKPVTKEPPKRRNQSWTQNDIVMRMVDAPKNNGNDDKVKNNDVALPTTFDALREVIRKSAVYKGSDAQQLPLIVFIKRRNDSLGKGWLRTLISGPWLAVGHLSERENAILGYFCTMLCGRGWGDWANQLGSSFNVSHGTVRGKHLEYFSNVFAVDTVRKPKLKKSDRKVDALEGSPSETGGTPPICDLSPAPKSANILL
jgi:hypothetical protein